MKIVKLDLSEIYLNDIETSFIWLFWTGMSTTDIAKTLSISEKKIYSLKLSLFRRIGLKNTFEFFCWFEANRVGIKKMIVRS